MSDAQKRFVAALSVATLVCWIYPMMMWAEAGPSWVIADAAANHYGAIALPLSIAAFVSAFSLGPIRARPKALHVVAIVIFLILVPLAVTMSIRDAGRPHVAPPHLLKGDEQIRAFAADVAIRKAVPAPHGSYDASPDPAKPSGWKSIAASNAWKDASCLTAIGSRRACLPSDESARSCYDACIPPIRSLTDFGDRAGVVGYAGAVHSVLATVYAAVMLWYLIVMALALRGTEEGERKSVFSRERLDLLLLSVLLQLVFFPTRLMTEWYQSYYLFSPMQEYIGYIVLAAVAISASLFLALMYTEALEKILAVVVAAASAVFGFVFVTKPDWMVVLFDLAQRTEFYAAFLVIALVVTASLCLLVLRFGRTVVHLPTIPPVDDDSEARPQH